MRLVNVYEDRDAASVLFDLLKERQKESWISHKAMPTREEHRRFVYGWPFRYWYLIDVDGHLVGELQCTDRNELGITLFKRFQRQRYGTQALRLFIETHTPLEAIPAIRNGHWLANIAVANIGSKLFFARLGFRAIQETWMLAPTIPAHLMADDATGVLTARAPWEDRPPQGGSPIEGEP